MPLRAHDVLSKSVVCVDTATPVKLREIRRRQASHVAIIERGHCLGVSNVHNSRLSQEETPLNAFLDNSLFVSVSESSSVEEYGRAFSDPNVEALVVQDKAGRFVGLITRQSLLEGLLTERGSEGRLTGSSGSSQQKRAESLLAGEKHVLETISTSRSKDGGLTELVEFVEEHAKDVACSILLVDNSGRRLTVCAATKLPAEFINAINGLEIGPSAGACGTAAFRNEPVFIADIATDPLCNDFREMALKHQLRSVWSSPICSSSGDVLGTIAIYNRQTGSPDGSQRALIDRAVHLAAIAIEKIRGLEALRASETRNRTLLEGSPVCTKIIDLDSRLQYMSAAGRNQLKISEIEPYYGTTFPPALYPESWRAPVTEQLERAKLGETTRLECPVLDTDGNAIWYDTTFVPARDKDGRIQYVIVTSVDITERRRAVDALRASETRNRTLLDGSPVCTKIIDLDSRLQYMSAAGQEQLKISNIESFYGETFPPKLYPEPMWKLATEHLERAKKGETTKAECCVLDTEGNELWYDTTFVPARDDDGRIQYIIVISVNVTERKHADEQARKHHDALAHVSRVGTMGELATGIAHELNQPLSAIASYSFAARKTAEKLSPDPQEPLCELLGKLEEQVIRAGEIVRRLREFVSNSESVREAADLNTLVQDVSKLLESDIRQGNININLKFDESSEVVRVDKIQIQQVLVNLIRNAIDAMGDTPELQHELCISTRSLQDGQMEVVVSDSGKGLEQDQLDQVFKAFYSTKQHGMGMGLPISRSIVEAHGGKLWAKSNNPTGMIFGFTVPTECEGDPKEHPTVFIVDDDSAMRDSLRISVQAMGCSVMCFSSAIDFLQRLTTYSVPKSACIVADIRMPKMDGMELLAQLKSQDNRIPIIMVTGHGTPALRQEAKELGAAALLEKPFRTTELQTVLEQCLSIQVTS